MIFNKRGHNILDPKSQKDRNTERQNYTKKERQRDRETDYTDRQIDRLTERQRDSCYFLALTTFDNNTRVITITSEC
jgi:hypothetical protein